MTAVVFERCGYEYAVRFRYDPALVDIIKTTVPAYARSWDPTLKQWTVDAECALPLAHTIRASGHTVVGLEPPRAETRSGDPADWARAVFRRVGPGRTDAVYRMLSRALHPDVGGETELMQELNQARREINP